MCLPRHAFFTISLAGSACCAGKRSRAISSFSSNPRARTPHEESEGNNSQREAVRDNKFACSNENPSRYSTLYRFYMRQLWSAGAANPLFEG